MLNEGLLVRDQVTVACFQEVRLYLEAELWAIKRFPPLDSER